MKRLIRWGSGVLAATIFVLGEIILLFFTYLICSAALNVMERGFNYEWDFPSALLVGFFSFILAFILDNAGALLVWYIELLDKIWE